MKDDEILKTFSNRVRELRTRKGLTQQELAELAEVEYKYIQKIEGKNPPSIGLLKLVKLIKALGVSFPRFFNFLK
ncbi:MAG: helix-turn-helix transcriptional regulator [Candidatus Omnitrophica bacterium]|nr:helix-turn-helix transcriptional regulator [Candidatus Omnitrophota bacterium]